MRMRYAILTGSLLLISLLSAQDGGQDARKYFQPHTGSATRAPADTPTVTTTGDGVVLREDPRVAKFMADYAARKQVLRGYRVQVFLGSDRKQGEEVRRSFLLKHPDVPAYLVYQAPNFKVRVGDLRDRIEAERLRQQLKTEFPGAYVVPDEIDLPRVQ
ncbi:MAG: SPOR domain-containing protein [Flavobacteriales bacterium]|nr:SPOR domain-containing protein [Flavobacteriales bacterium]